MHKYTMYPWGTMTKSRLFVDYLIYKSSNALENKPSREFRVGRSKNPELIDEVRQSGLGLFN